MTGIDYVDIERTLLAYLLIRPDMFPECDVKSDAFSVGFHRRLHEGMALAWEDGLKDLDAPQVLHSMVDAGLLKADDETEYAEATHTIAGILHYGMQKPSAIKRGMVDHYAKQIMEGKLKRTISSIKHQTSVDVLDREQEETEVLQNEIVAIDDAEDAYRPRYTVSIEAALDKAEEQMNQFGGKRIPLGVKLVEDICGDMYPGTVLTILGRTSVGKTYFVTNMINAMTKLPERKFSMFFASLEMSEYATISRLARAYHEVGSYELDDHRGTPLDKRRSYVQTIRGDVGFHFKHSSSFHDIAIAMRQWERSYADHPIGVVFLDYLQYLKVEGKESPYERGSRLAREAKEFAKENNVLLVLLSQIKRTDKDDESLYRPPSLTDGRDSGAIEESADVMVGLWRDAAMGHLINVKTLKVRDGTAPGNECVLQMDWRTGVMGETPYGGYGDGEKRKGAEDRSRHPAPNSESKHEPGNQQACFDAEDESGT